MQGENVSWYVLSEIVRLFTFSGIFQKVLAVQCLYMPFSTALYILFTPALHFILNTGVVIQSDDKPEASSQTLCMCSRSIMYSTVLIGSSLQAGCCQVKKTFLGIFAASWIFWPLSDAFNFRYNGLVCLFMLLS